MPQVVALKRVVVRQPEVKQNRLSMLACVDGWID